MSSIAYPVSLRRERPPAPSQWPADTRVAHRDLFPTRFSGLQVLHKIGEGCRCVVFAARAGEDTDFVLEIYRSTAIEKHIRHCRTPLARYEYERNLAFQALTPRPVLFDFNKIPYHIRPPNAVFGLLLKMRLLVPGSRDRRYFNRLSRLCDGHAPNA